MLNTFFTSKITCFTLANAYGLSTHIKGWLKVSILLLFCLASLQAKAQLPEEVRWMQAAKFGVSHHYLAGGTLSNAYYQITDYDNWNNYIEGFDVQAYADLMEKLGAGYVLFTLTQNRGYLATTSDIYDINSPPCPPQSISPGCKNQSNKNKADYTPNRDLIADLGAALKAKNIRLIAYIPYHVPDRWTGKQVPTVAPDWYISDFITEKAKVWGNNVSGWWFDGYWEIRENEQKSDFPITSKLYAAITRGNPDAILALNSGIGSDVTTTHDKFSQYSPGEHDDLPPVPASAEREGWGGNKILQVGWTFLSKEDPVFVGWGQLTRNLKYSNEEVANRAKAIADVHAVSTWDVAINPNGSWPLDRIIQMQVVGNTVGTSSDTTYSSLNIVNNDNSDITYSSDWSYLPDRGTGAFNQDVHSTAKNGAYFSYNFSGSSIVFATTKASDQGDVEIFIDNESQGVFSTYDGNGNRQVQSIIFEKHDLSHSNHTLKVVKKSGDHLLVDVVAAKSGKLSRLQNFIGSIFK